MPIPRRTPVTNRTEICRLWSKRHLPAIRFEIRMNLSEARISDRYDAMASA